MLNFILFLKGFDIKSTDLHTICTNIFQSCTEIIFDSRIVRRTVCESMSSRVQKLLQWVVALENQHTIRAVCACALDFGEKHAESNNDVAGLLLGILALIRHATKCQTYHFSCPRLELFHLAHSRYFVKLEATRGAYDPMDSRLLRSTSDMSELSQCRECNRNFEFLNKPKRRVKAIARFIRGCVSL